MAINSFYNSMTTSVTLAASKLNKVDRTFLAAVCFTTIGIYFHSIWNSFILLIGLPISIMGIRSSNQWNKMTSLLIQMKCSIVTRDSHVQLLYSAHQVDPSTVGLRSTKPGNEVGRLFLLMTCALFTGASMVRLLNSAHPVNLSVMMCTSWIVALVVMCIQLQNKRVKYVFWPYIQFSGLGMLTIAYPASTVFGVSIFDHSQWWMIPRVFSAILWVGFVKLIRKDHEDDDDYVLHAFYTFITFIDYSIHLMFSW